MDRRHSIDIIIFIRKTKSPERKQLTTAGVMASIADGLMYGCGDAVIGINRFGASAPGSLVLKKYGIKASAIVSKAMKLLNS